MNKACIWQCILLEEVGIEAGGGGGGWGGNDEEGWLLNDDAWLQTGEGVKNLGKSDNIISECSQLCNS